MRWGTAPELVGPRQAYRVRRLADFLTSTVRSGRVLDAGCGAGALTELLARRGYHVTAVDTSAEFVSYTRARLARKGLAERVAVQWLDVETASTDEVLWSPETFEAAVCGEVLEHVANDDAAVRFIAAALKPDGVLVLSVPAGAARYDWLDRWAGHYRRYERDSLCSLLARAGLEVETMIRWGFPFMTLYERFIQRPGLGHASNSGGETSVVARLARSGPVTWALTNVFSLDRVFESRVPWGTGFFVVARKPKSREIPSAGRTIGPRGEASR
jgi:SAM-dependent methyltransferase